MAGKDVRYYRERAASELGLALRAERQDVAAIHEELARRYLTLLDRQEKAPNPWAFTTDQEAA